jgi:hypothetical protein
MFRVCTKLDVKVASCFLVDCRLILLTFGYYHSCQWRYVPCSVYYNFWRNVRLKYETCQLLLCSVIIYRIFGIYNSEKFHKYVLVV